MAQQEKQPSRPWTAPTEMEAWDVLFKAVLMAKERALGRIFLSIPLSRYLEFREAKKDFDFPIWLTIKNR
jgi:hypothetical protein